ncbi:MAG: proprotein convertase P-domain-containing protein, partial [Saprospiraceae bacterium]|nr:proprotein convertase P-domain-containing protein [Saprospiraceae bacterium]
SQYGCGNDNINVTFSDAAANNAAALENQCNTNPALSGTFQPIMPLSVLNGQDVGGEWRLFVTDNVGEDGGSIDQWSLTFCFQSDIPAGAMVHNNTLTVPQGGTEDITTDYLQAFASGQATQLTYTLLQLPQHGALLLNGNLMNAGAVFTQADIDAGALSYTHNGDQSLTDNFHFDVYDAQNFSWLHEQIFSIVILQNDLAATAAITHVVSCNNGNDGAITVTATGLDGNYQYSLNGGAPQSSNVFDNLSAGTYTVVVSSQLGFSTTVGPFVIVNPVLLEADAIVEADQVTASGAGGTAPYTYRLDGQDYQDSPVFLSVSNGIHTITVQDANGCVATTQVIVAVNTLLAYTEGSQNVSCFGGANGVLTVTAAGSTPPFEFSINGADFQTSNVFTGLSAGFYTVIVRDASSMAVFTNEVELTQPTQLVLEASTNVNDIALTPSGGTPPYTLTINDEPTGALEFMDLEAGEYTFVVTDANGCTATAQATALGNTLVNFFQAVSAVSCAGDQDGVIGLCIDGGYGPLTATISPEAGTFIGGSSASCAFQATFTNLPPDAYTITITDSLGFSISAGATVTAPEPLTLEVVNQGDTIIALVSGGTFSYEYSLDGENWQPEPIFPGLQEGYYTVFARDIKHCSDSLTYFLNLTSTVDPATAWGVSVSPNPGAGLFNIRLANAPDHLLGEISDMTGRSLRSLEF